MLHSLNISNYALIQALEAGFSEGLTIITGETGAGKSIILGALSLLLGEKADKAFLRDPSKNAVVEALFKIPVTAWQREHFADLEGPEWEDLTAPEQTIDLVIRRIVYPTGQSRAFVNDQPVQLGLLKTLGNTLIDIHSQHENLLLSQSDYPLKVVDHFAGHTALLESYKAVHKKVVDLTARVRALRAAYEKSRQETEYIQFQFTELEQARLVEGEQEEWEQQLKILENAADIRRAFYEITQLLEEGQVPVLSQLKEAERLAREAARHNPDYNHIGQRLEQARLELKDLAQECAAQLEHVREEPQRMEQISQRLDVLYTLQRKHNVQTVEALMARMAFFEEQLQAVQDDSTLLEQWEAELETLTEERNRLALLLHESRGKALEPLSSDLCSRLALLGIPHAQLVFDLQVKPEYGPLGNSGLQMLFSANRDVEPKELSRIASGGEMSRLMLCIKSITAQSAGLNTIIFDEVDLGVSGKIADSMGDMIYALSGHMQVLAITHLPQVAAKGGTHYLVKKEWAEDATQTGIVLLTGEERVMEIARMLSGSAVTPAAVENARELLNDKS
ncbi:MAG: DNA repair protein RecN [Bacteroidales bacterium]